MERRNKSIYVLVDRRKMPAKRLAFVFGLKYSTVRKIVSRWKHRGVMSHI